MLVLVLLSAVMGEKNHLEALVAYYWNNYKLVKYNFSDKCKSRFTALPA